jgi:folate-dependent phosphoribosylglycinamide formyltransferase PurN
MSAESELNRRIAGVQQYSAQAPAAPPIRVVLICGRFREPAARRFLVMLDEHPEIELAAAFAQGSAAAPRERFADLWRRRGLLSVPVLAFASLAGLGQRIFRSAETAAWERRAALLEQRISVVPDLHAPEVLAQVRALAPDLGLIYGSPLLKPSLFLIPRLGTLGIHHGKLPEYRGRKTTFWQVYHGEGSVGVTIQQVNTGADTGQIVAEGAIPVQRKSFRRIVRESQALGIELYLDAILQMKRGTAIPRAPTGRPGPHFRDPTLWQMLQLPLRRILARMRS